MSAALNIPEGFVSTSAQSTIAFQNPSNWIKAKADGVMVQGIFEGMTEPDQYQKCNFAFLATADGISYDKEGNEKSFKAGDKVIVNTSSNIKSKLSEVEAGTEVIVVYEGQNKLTKGPYKGKLAHTYNVLKRA